MPFETGDGTGMAGNPMVLIFNAKGPLQAPGDAPEGFPQWIPPGDHPNGSPQGSPPGVVRGILWGEGMYINKE